MNNDNDNQFFDTTSPARATYPDHVIEHLPSSTLASHPSNSSQAQDVTATGMSLSDVNMLDEWSHDSSAYALGGNWATQPYITPTNIAQYDASSQDLLMHQPNITLSVCMLLPTSINSFTY